jgi:hypothetical protein
MPHVSKREFLDEANRRLFLHPDYRQGMRFLPYPKDSGPEKASGYTWEPEADGQAEPFKPIVDAMAADDWAVDPLPGDLAYTEPDPEP